MEYLIKEETTDHDFSENLKGTQVPVLVLDQKWHHLFVGMEKTENIAQQEQCVNELLKEQGRLQQELKELKHLKSTLMENIMANMEGAESDTHPQSHKLQEDRRLIDEINEKMEICQDAMLDLPARLREANNLLMQETMTLCYSRIRENAHQADEIGEWIKEIRIELKKQIIRKQSAEIKNREIYSYMHDIFGHKIIDIFDLQYQEVKEPIPEQEADEQETPQP